MGAWEQEKEELGREVMGLAYASRCIETVFNTRKPAKRKDGWILKNGTNSIYFVNFRNAGNSAKFTAKLGYLMGRTLVEEVKDYDVFIGIEMAGVPLVSAASTAMYLVTDGKVDIKWGYTRPLPVEKIRDVEAVKKVLEELKKNKISLGEWGAHNLIEGEILDGYKVVLGDDMVTDFGSKLIGREILNYEIERLGVNATCTDVVVGIDREQGGTEGAQKAGMRLVSGVPMKTKGIGWLDGAMPREQYEHLERFINQPALYQDIGRDPKIDRQKGKNSPEMEAALELARKVA